MGEVIEGKDASARFRFIMEHAEDAQELDVLSGSSRCMSPVCVMSLIVMRDRWPERVVAGICRRLLACYAFGVVVARSFRCGGNLPVPLPVLATIGLIIGALFIVSVNPVPIAIWFYVGSGATEKDIPLRSIAH